MRRIHLSVQLLLVLCVALLGGPYLPDAFKAFFYGTSLSLKEILVGMLPVIIFSCLYSSMLAQKGQAIRFISILMACICLSNATSAGIAYAAVKLGLPLLPKLSPMAIALAPASVLNASWYLQLPRWLPNEMALLAGFLLGGLSTYWPHPGFQRFAHALNRFVFFFLKRLFAPVIPLFAFGFLLKLQHEGVLKLLLSLYAPMMGLFLITAVTYLALLYGLAAGLQRSRWLGYIKQVLPAGMMGFSAMSSMAALPLSLQAAEHNTQEPALSQAIVPATVNIHLVGDGLWIPMMALAILLGQHWDLPNVAQYLPFVGYFVLYKFAVAGVPGGGIMVMLPILERFLHFNGDMLALITALYILFDCLITSVNVFGNGAFVILMTRLFRPQAAPVTAT